MFEQSILATGPAARKTGAVFASFGAQIAGIGVLICVPLMYSDTLPNVKLTMPLVSPVSVPPPVQASAVPASTSVTTAVHPNSAAHIFRPPLNNASSFSSSAPFSLDVDGAPRFTLGDGAAPGIPQLGALLPPEKPRVSAAPAEPKPSPQPVQVGGDVQAAKILKKIIPSYPALGKQMRVSGTVHLIGVIAKDGTVQKLQVVSGNPLLVRAAIDAVSQWIY
jgi:periplasmic protein TonB